MNMNQRFKKAFRLAWRNRDTNFNHCNNIYCQDFFLRLKKGKAKSDILRKSGDKFEKVSRDLILNTWEEQRVKEECDKATGVHGNGNSSGGKGKGQVNAIANGKKAPAKNTTTKPKSPPASTAKPTATPKRNGKYNGHDIPPEQKTQANTPPACGRLQRICQLLLPSVPWSCNK